MSNPHTSRIKARPPEPPAPVAPDAPDSVAPIAVRLPNWVGDVCMALPTLAALRRLAPLHCFGKGWAADLLAGLPYRVERLPKGVRGAAAALRASGAARGLLLTNSFASALHMRWAGIPAVGYRKDWRSPLLAVRVEREPGLHEVDSFWRLGQAFARDPLADGGPAENAFPAAAPRELLLPLHDRHRSQAAAAIAAAGIHGAYSVLCPLAVGSSGGRSKVWPHFRALSRWLALRGDTVVACPGPGEEAATAAALGGARLLPGLGLGAYAAVLAGAQRVAANDTGPMHLAAAIGAPVLGIFGVSDPQRTRPWCRRCAVIGSAEGWPTLAEAQRAFDALPPREAGER